MLSLSIFFTLLSLFTLSLDFFSLIFQSTFTLISHSIFYLNFLSLLSHVTFFLTLFSLNFLLLLSFSNLLTYFLFHFFSPPFSQSSFFSLYFLVPPSLPTLSSHFIILLLEFLSPLFLSLFLTSFYLFDLFTFFLNQIFLIYFSCFAFSLLVKFLKHNQQIRIDIKYRIDMLVVDIEYD